MLSKERSGTATYRFSEAYKLRVRHNEPQTRPLAGLNQARICKPCVSFTLPASGRQ
ncbi:hypothetical protein GCM10022278_26470 [Allohahella marinimesophila]|uniref:Uncharacterized protein n=1 Tax=Allohahella marinimesophila TaxID=1054972 RepID=A0ABP7PL03_9GAMM